MWEESRVSNTERNLRSAISRWQGFVAAGGGNGQPYDEVEVEKFLNDDGSIRPQVASTGTAFANYLKAQSCSCIAFLQNMDVVRSHLIFFGLKKYFFVLSFEDFK